MWLTRVYQSLKVREVRLAWAVALAADGIQILLLPLFVGGGVSPADALIDLSAAFVLSKLLGWTGSFSPPGLAELVPGVDFAPPWTSAVAFVPLQGPRSPESDIPVQRWSPRRFLNS